MKVTRIFRLKSYRLFRDFTWPSDLQNFGRFNLIYGWNGSGKTTLATLFRNLQDKTAVTLGEVVFEIDNRLVKDVEIPTAVLPPVRVFNRDFVAATILASEREISPIYFLGQDSVEKQQRVEKLKKELSQAETEVKDSQSEKASADRALDDFCITKGKMIKELLISSRSTTYNNYDKRRFRQSVEAMNQESRRSALFNDNEKIRLRSQKDAQPKASITTVTCEVPDFAVLTTSVEELLNRSVISRVIDSLAGDREVGSWVRQGLAFHTGNRTTNECRFCGQAVPPERISALEAHFNDAFSQFQSEIDGLAATIEDHRQRLTVISPPASSQLYDHLAAKFDSASVIMRRFLEAATSYLGALYTRLATKRESPFSNESLNSPDIPNRNDISDAVAVLNAVIESHNTTTLRFQNEVDDACQKLEQCYIAESYDEFIQLRDTTIAANSLVSKAATKTQSLRDQIASVEREIVEHRRPAEELNAELHAYLGRNELRFEVKETGYSMTRGGQPASDLSEGEKTAIAFLYFLKSLQDKSFDLTKGVVVIDDPVSSLDANALFSAFGYMKERTKEAGQLFVMTHNFSFFQQVKNWYHHLKHQKGKNVANRPARFYLLNVTACDGHRQAALAPIDPLLERFESEYHYIFKRVYDESQRGANVVTLKECYEMPNIARRLIEAFLSFRYPACSGELAQQLDAVSFDAAKKARILRFLNTHSHLGHISEPEHDPYVLSETGAILSDVMSLIETTDKDHFNGMKALVADKPEEGVATVES